MSTPEQWQIRCPGCKRLYTDPTVRDNVYRVCPHCRVKVEHAELIRGRDGVCAVKPEQPTAWESRFLAIYPDGTESDFDLGGYILRPGDEIPGKGGIVLDRWDVTDIPIERGEFGVVGILRDPESSV